MGAPPASRPPLVSIVVPTWNSATCLPALLESIEAQIYPALEVIVVDNASSDDTVPLVYQSMPSALVLRRLANTGYAGAANAGIAYARGKYVLVTNDDVRLRYDAVAQLVAALEAGPEYGSASAKVLRPRHDQGLAILDSTGIELGVAHLAPRDRGSGEPDRGQYDANADIVGPSGAAGFYRRAALLECATEGGIFDESFGSYYEDVDLAWRMQRLGWKSCYVPSAIVIHARRGARRLPLAMRRQAWVNRYAVFLHHLPLRALLGRPLLWEIGRLTRAGLREPALLTAVGELARRWPQIQARRREIARLVADARRLQVNHAGGDP